MWLFLVLVAAAVVEGRNITPDDIARGRELCNQQCGMLTASSRATCLRVCWRNYFASLNGSKSLPTQVRGPRVARHKRSSATRDAVFFFLATILGLAVSI
jgi:hypothetical protein